MTRAEHSDPVSQAKELWGTISVHRWSVSFLGILLAAVAVVVISLLPSSYQASTTVVFDPERLPERYVSPTVMTDPSQRLNTLTQEVLSAGRLQEINQQLHMNPDAEMSPQAVAQMRKAIQIDMKPSPEAGMSAFAITYTGRDPQLVAAVANRLAQSFIDWDLANREQQATSTAKFMSEQLQEAKQVLDNEAAKVHDYKVKHSGELPEQLQSNMQELSLLRSALQANTESTERLEEESAMLTANPNAGRTTTTAPTERDRLEAERRTLKDELVALRAEYTEHYPDVAAARDRLEIVNKQLNTMDAVSSTDSAGTSPGAARLAVIKTQVAHLQDEKKSIVQHMNKYQAQIDAAEVRGQELDDLTRNYDNAREQYDGLQDKNFHAEMAMDLERQRKSARFTVDPAQVPDEPVKPNRPLLFAVLIPICLVIPAGFVIGLEEIRGTVNSERGLRALLPNAARVMGHIPIIETPSGVRKQRRLALLSILGSIGCCIAVTAFLWGSPAARVKRNHAHQFKPSSPNAELLRRQ